MAVAIKKLELIHPRCLASKPKTFAISGSAKFKDEPIYGTKKDVRQSVKSTADFLFCI
jgi:hypothetical protein